MVAGIPSFDKPEFRSFEQRSNNTGNFKNDLYDDLQSSSFDFSWKDASYDRSHEEIQLKEFFVAAIDQTSDHNKLGLIVGPSGTGKTTLALTLKSVVNEVGGHFIQGKFDQVKMQTGTYMPFVEAFSELAEILVAADAEQKDQSLLDLRKKIHNATKGEIGLLTRMIPALQGIVGQQAYQVATSIRSESLVRLRHVFSNFASCICSYEKPVLLFLDDLQWANKEALDLLSALLTDSSINGLVILGACRSNEVSIDADLSATLRALEDNHDLQITQISLGNMDQQGVHRFIADTFTVDETLCKELSDTVFAKTEGNIFHTLELLRSLDETGAIYLSGNGKSLALNVSKMQALHGGAESHNVADLIGSRLLRLPVALHKVLMIAAAMGAEFDPAMVLLSLDAAPSDAFQSLAAMAVIVHVKSNPPRFRFSHDKIQQACYSLITEQDRPAFLLSAGRRLWKNLTKSNLVDGNSHLVTQLLCGSLDLITDNLERVATAELFLFTGKKAVDASCFYAAASLLASARCLLPQRSWRDHYGLTMNIFIASAEVEQVLCNFEQSEVLALEIMENARSSRDQLPAYTVRLNGLGSSCRFDEAIKLGLAALDILKTPLPKKATRMHLFFLHRRIYARLKNLTMSDIMSLPLMTDADKLATMNILNIMFTYAFSCQSLYAPLVSLSMVELTLKHGLSVYSAIGFGIYSMLLSGVFEKFEEAYKYGQLALRLVDRFGIRTWLPRIYFVVFAMTNPSLMPIRNSIKPMMEAYETGMACGDTFCAMLSLHFAAMFRLYGSEDIGGLLTIGIAYRKVIASYKNEFMIAIYNPFLQMLENLRGGSAEYLTLTGSYMNEDTAIAFARRQKYMSGLACMLYFKLLLAFIMSDYPNAELIYDELCPLFYVLSQLARCYIAYIGGVSKLVLIRRTGQKRRRRLRQARRCLALVKRHAKHSPENNMQKLYFLEAQFLWLNFKVDDALTKLQRAAEWAHREGALLDQGITVQSMGSLLCQQGRMEEGLEEMRRSQCLFREWGATIKVSQLDHAEKLIS